MKWLPRIPRPKNPYVRALPVVVAISLVTFLAEGRGWLRGFETATFDIWFHVKPARLAEQIVIVEINQDDYKDLFNGESPLDEARLSELLAAIAACGPRVIGVDLDTSGKSFSGVRIPPGYEDRIVWARTAALVGDKLKPMRVLGGREAAHSGLALNPEDPDTAIRRYRRSLETIEGRRLPSFAWAIWKASRGGFPSEPEEDEHEGRYYRRYRFPEPIAASVVLRGAKLKNWVMNGPLLNKIVLLGATYAEALDTHLTAEGPKNGVEIVAQEVASESEGGGIGHVQQALLLLVEMGAGLALVAIHHRYPIGRALLLSLVAIPSLALVGSLLVFASFAFWANVVPTSVSVLIHQLCEHIGKYRRLYLEAQAAAAARAD